MIYWNSQEDVWFLFVDRLLYSIFIPARKEFPLPFLPWCISWPIGCLFAFLWSITSLAMARDRWIAASRCLHGLWSSHCIKYSCWFGIKIHCPLPLGCTIREFSMFIIGFPLQQIYPHKSPAVTQSMDNGNAFSWPPYSLVTLIIMNVSPFLLVLSLL